MDRGRWCFLCYLKRAVNNKNITYYVALVFWVSLFFYTGCSHENEPIPVDCATSNLTLTITSTDLNSCSASDGSITASANGGGGPYQFALDAQSFGTSTKFTGLGAGMYQLKVKDKNGCERAISVTIKPTGSTLAATFSLTNSSCKTSTGTLTINATGGTGPYTYRINEGTASPSNLINALAAGSYSVKVTDNAGCSITQTVKVLSDIKFSTDVKSIIDANCAISGCHVSGGGRISFTTFNNIQANASEIKSRTQSGNMPKNAAKLPLAELNAIACWVDDGAPNN